MYTYIINSYYERICVEFTKKTTLIFLFSKLHASPKIIYD